MAFCAPKQLSVSLPAVVPQLTEVLKDSHAQVRQAAARSLKQFSEVISNPEIRSLVPLLQRALVDPDKTPDALRSLLETTFIHYVDTPSLAIVRSFSVCFLFLQYVSFRSSQYWRMVSAHAALTPSVWRSKSWAI